MNVETYLYCLKTLARSVIADKEMLALCRKRGNSGFTSRLEEENSFSIEELSLIKSHIFNIRDVEKRLKKKQRLYDRFIVRLSRALALIRDDRYRDFISMHYIYDVPAEEIAVRKNYAERSVYRLGSKARKELHRALLSVSPRPVRLEREKNKHYIISSRRVLLSCREIVCSGKNRRALPEIKGGMSVYRGMTQARFY